jgi:hypothetical protein
MWEHVFAMEDPEPLRKCSRCREWKPTTAFTLRGSSRSRPDTYCRPCRSAYGTEHPEANRATYIAKAHARKELELRKRFEYVVDYLHAHPCTDCGESDPLVLEFDQLGDKEFNVSYGIQNIGWKRVLEEQQMRGPLRELSSAAGPRPNGATGAPSSPSRPNESGRRGSNSY